jgi:hypothetical protein
MTVEHADGMRVAKPKHQANNLSTNVVHPITCQMAEVKPAFSFVRAAVFWGGPPQTLDTLQLTRADLALLSFGLSFVAFVVRTR